MNNIQNLKIKVWIFVGLLGIGLILFISQSTHAFAQPIEPFDSIKKIHFLIRNDTPYEIDGYIERKLDVYEASISSDKNLLAYTQKRKDKWGIEPYIFIYNLNQQRQELSIRLDDNDVDRFVWSWSPDSEYILLINKSQSVGEIMGEIYHIKTQKKVETFQMYEYSSEWIDQSKLIYTSPHKNCDNEFCYMESVEVKSIDMSQNENKIIRTIPIMKGISTFVDIVNNSGEIVAKVKEYINGELVEEKIIDINF